MRIFINKHRIGAVIVCFDEFDRAQFLKHVFHLDKPWGLPGGWLMRKDDPGTTVLRELFEETGWTADLGPVIYTSHEPLPDHIGIAYIAWVNPGKMKINPEIVETMWCLPQDIQEPLMPFTTKALEAAGNSYREKSAGAAAK